MKKILFIFFIWFSFHICVSAQEQDMPPQLSIGQMYEDFDEFAEIVSDVNPQLKIRYKITGYNQLDTLKKLRGKIGGISNYYDFIRLMSQATRHMHDIHCYMLPRPMPLAGIGYCDTAAIRQIREGYTKYFSEENSLDYFFANNIPVPMVNINGEYYTSGTWQILDRELSEQGFCDQEPFVSKARIINYYGKSYQTYVEENLLSLGTPRWDFDSSRFFHHSSYLKRGGILEIINHDEKHMFVNTQVNDSLCIVVASASIDEFKSKSMRSSISLPSLGAVYLDSLNVLYIFMEQMQDKDNVLINEIKKASANKTVNKIVIDVRENRGGGDGVWHSVLKYIIKDTLDVKVSAAYKKSKYMEKYADERTKSEMKSKKISQLDDEEYWVTDGGLTFIPDAEGLHYDGKIYILQDRET
ncbi:MAG: S41 family peptidase, partial [Prevotellaceae bacterium]|nr:S41 family peptidase [Prevotellaceae bacterium]